MKSKVTLLLAAAFLFVVPMAANAGLTAYSQNFEAMVQSDPGALTTDGWLVYGNVFSPDHSTWYYGYGSFPAPNGTGAFCNVDLVAPATPGNGAQDMVVFSDYNNGGAHAAGQQVEANVFREQIADAADDGTTWTFSFDAMMGNLEAPTTAAAFIKVLDPNQGWATTHFLTFDTTNIPASWATHSLQITVDAAMVGTHVQYGFMNTASNYKGSGVFYDNINWQNSSVTPAKPTTWGKLKSLYR